MRPRFSLPAIFIAVVVTCSIAATCARAGSEKSIRAGTNVTSPAKNFTVSAPEFCLGTYVQKKANKDGGTIVFTSDLGELNRIDYSRLRDDVAAIVAGSDTVAKAGLYRQALENVVAENRGKILSQEPLTLSGMSALFAVAAFPQGSVVAQAKWQDGKMVNERQDSVRGLLIFARRGFLYLLHCEVGIDFAALWSDCESSKGGPNLSPEERDQAAKLNLQEFYSTISFR